MLKRKLQIRIVSVSALGMTLSLLGSGCARLYPGAKQSEEKVNADKNEAAAGESKSPGIMSRILSKDQAGYGWDGQASSTTLDMRMDSAFVRAMSTVKGMGFIIKEEQSSKQNAKAKIQGAKADQTQVTVWLEDAADSPGKTMVRVKVGGLGDRTGSERVLDEMAANKKKKAAESAPPPSSTK